MALLSGYEHLLAYLKSHGTLLNAVKPELLLDIADFRYVYPFTMETRSAEETSCIWMDV